MEPHATTAPPPPPPQPPANLPDRSPRRWARPLGVVAAGAVAVAAIGSATGAFDTGPAHPDAWDPRVAELADFVEDERGLDFEQPVQVDFLSAREYSEATTTGAAGLADDELLELDRYAAELRAFGLATGELDLVEALNAVSDGGTLAFYDPDDERIRVRGTELTPGLRVTLVHELTHALQDQHFDLGRLYDDDLESSERTAFLGLVEGDALRVETGYTSRGLSATERQEYEQEYQGELERSREATSDVPPFVAASFAVPYALGQPLAVMLANQGGNAAVDRAFDDPPSTEEHLFDPASYLDDEPGYSLDLNVRDLEVIEQRPCAGGRFLEAAHHLFREHRGEVVRHRPLRVRRLDLPRAGARGSERFVHHRPVSYFRFLALASSVASCAESARIPHCIASTISSRLKPQ